ncbi:RNase H family protein [Ekhidna sp.]
MIDKLFLFVDGSADPKLKIGCGAYLPVNENELRLDSKSAQVKVNLFRETSSTKLELQTLIWALTEIRESSRKIVVFTDSQNIIGLLKRQKRLEQSNYHSKTGKLLKNHELYRKFYEIMNQLDCELIKVKGHLSSMQKDDMDRLFTLVDRASRKALQDVKKMIQ